MRKNNGSVFGWLIPVGVIIALIAIFGKLPSLAVTGGIVMGALLILVAAIMFISLKTSNEEAKQKAADMSWRPSRRSRPASAKPRCSSSTTCPPRKTS